MIWIPSVRQVLMNILLRAGFNSQSTLKRNCKLSRLTVKRNSVDVCFISLFFGTFGHFDYLVSYYLEIKEMLWHFCFSNSGQICVFFENLWVFIKPRKQIQLILWKMKVGGNVSISQCPDPFIEQTKSQNSFRARLPMGGGLEGRYPRPAPLWPEPEFAKICDNSHLDSQAKIHRQSTLSSRDNFINYLPYFVYSIFQEAPQVSLYIYLYATGWNTV